MSLSVSQRQGFAAVVQPTVKGVEHLLRAVDRTPSVEKGQGRQGTEAGCGWESLWAASLVKEEAHHASWLYDRDHAAARARQVSIIFCARCPLRPSRPAAAAAAPSRFGCFGTPLCSVPCLAIPSLMVPHRAVHPPSALPSPSMQWCSHPRWPPCPATSATEGRGTCTAKLTGTWRPCAPGNPTSREPPQRCPCRNHLLPRPAPYAPWAVDRLARQAVHRCGGRRPLTCLRCPARTVATEYGAA